NFDYSTSTTGTTTGIATVKKGGTTIVGSSPPKNLTSGINKSGFIQVDIPAGTADGAYDVKVEITNTSGTGSGQKTDTQSNSLIISTCTSPAVTTQPTNQSV